MMLLRPQQLGLEEAGAGLGQGAQSTLHDLCPGWQCLPISLHLVQRAAPSQGSTGKLRAPQILAQLSTGCVSANPELPKNSERHVLCLLALLQGAACAPHAGQPPVPLSGVCDDSSSFPTLCPFLGLHSWLCLTLPPAPFVLQAAPESGAVPRHTRRAGGQGDSGLEGRPRAAWWPQVPSPCPARSSPFLGLPTSICCG